MPKRCICERTPEAGPSTHRGVVHLRNCEHSELRKTTKKFKKLPRSRAVPGTRKIILIDD